LTDFEGLVARAMFLRCLQTGAANGCRLSSRNPFGPRLATCNWTTGNRTYQRFVQQGNRFKATAASEAAPEATSKWSYVAFAKTFPFANNMIIATAKTSVADLLAQVVLERKSFQDIDWKRNLVFCMFGAAYLGGFQYLYQISVFKRMFPGMEAFTSQPWAAKLKDVPGLLALGAQTALDLGMLTFVYLPTFYVFKASVFSESQNPVEWVKSGVGNYWKNWNKDVYDVFRVWGPADLLCFSVPLYLRLPVRHVVSFVWTAYLSFARGGNK